MGWKITVKNLLFFAFLRQIPISQIGNVLLLKFHFDHSYLLPSKFLKKKIQWSSYHEITPYAGRIKKINLGRFSKTKNMYFLVFAEIVNLQVGKLSTYLTGNGINQNLGAIQNPPVEGLKFFDIAPISSRQRWHR